LRVADLDLTYITKRVIALGFPAQGGEGLFRNRAEEVSRFFDLRHPNHYRIYNLCVERDHDVGTLFAEKAQAHHTKHIPTCCSPFFLHVLRGFACPR